MRAYLDNVIASGRVLGDLAPAGEMAAVRRLEQLASLGAITLCTSRESWREQERTRDPAKHSLLKATRSEIPLVYYDHRALGAGAPCQDRFGGFITSIIPSDVTDEALLSELKARGLRDGDARHLMYAVSNACDRFVSLDPDFLSRRSVLEGLCAGMRIVTPSELVLELARRV